MRRLLLCSVVALLSCKHSAAPDAPTSSEPAPVELAGCALAAPCTLEGGLVIEVTEIKDSRCPEGAACVWEGDAAVMVRAGEEAVSLHTNSTVGPASVTLASGQTLALDGVEPRATVSEPFPSQRVQLSVP